MPASCPARLAAATTGWSAARVTSSCRRRGFCDVEFAHGGNDFLDGGGGNDYLVGDAAGMFDEARAATTLLGGDGNDSSSAILMVG